MDCEYQMPTATINLSKRQLGKSLKLASRVAAEVPRTAKYTMGIAHTRRATHGGIALMNTHPHHDMHGNFTLVHNGIIENYHKLKQDLIAQGYQFYGETDTEVIANLLRRKLDRKFLSKPSKRH
jgi:glucosamine--fructose-6-phosphate aminotransferase (isomerizing)